MSGCLSRQLENKRAGDPSGFYRIPVGLSFLALFPPTAPAAAPCAELEISSRVMATLLITPPVINEMKMLLAVWKIFYCPVTASKSLFVLFLKNVHANQSNMVCCFYGFIQWGVDWHVLASGAGGKLERRQQTSFCTLNKGREWRGKPSPSPGAKILNTTSSSFGNTDIRTPL